MNVMRTLRLDVLRLDGVDIALAAAERYRALRAHEVTVTKIIDGITATGCLADALALLHNGRDFDPFAK